jgi:hypothetical protein
VQLELTDGWYWLRASGDERLTQLARSNRIGQGGLWLLLQMRVPCPAPSCIPSAPACVPSGVLL